MISFNQDYSSKNTGLRKSSAYCGGLVIFNDEGKLRVIEGRKAERPMFCLVHIGSAGYRTTNVMN